MMDMVNLRSFTVTHVPWSHTKPARVRIYDNRFKKWVFAPYHNSELDRQEQIAQEYLLKLGIRCTMVSQGKKGFLLLTKDFETQLK